MTHNYGRRWACQSRASTASRWTRMMLSMGGLRAWAMGRSTSRTPRGSRVRAHAWSGVRLCRISKGFNDIPYSLPKAQAQ